MFLARRHPDLFALSALALVCAAVFWPLLSGQTLYYGDLQLYFQPMATFWQSHLAAGRVPLWNAGILGGAPFVGSPQMWILYPSALLFLVFPAVKALAISTLLHFWLAGAFFYGWTRRGALNLRPLAALLGACVWMLCGFVVSKSQFPNMLGAIAWVPAVLWAGEAFAARADARSTLILALTLALQLLAAHAQISLLTGYMLVVVAFAHWRAAPNRPLGRRVVIRFAGALVLVGLLTLGQTLPVVEALGATVRQDLGLYSASRFAVWPQTLIILVLPYFYGNPMQNVWNYPPPMNVWETACYLGLVPLALGFVALKNEARARFWGWWSLVWLWLALGVVGGLWVLAYFLLPGVSRFHDAGRFLVGFSLGGAILAALGTHWLLSRGRDGARWASLALVLTSLNLGVYARGFYPTMTVELARLAPPPPWGDDEWIEARQARIWTLDMEALWRMFQPISQMRPNDVENTRQFFAVYPPNRHLLRGWIEEVGYEPMFDRATQKRVQSLDLGFENNRFSPRLAAQLSRNSVRILQLTRATPLPETRDWTLVGATQTPVDGLRTFYYRNELCLPRARWRGGDGAWQRAAIVEETSSSLALEVPAGATTVELADSMRPGWSATLDGRAVTIETTAEGWRRVPIAADAKARQLRFEYAPMSWKLGVFVSLCALGFTIAGLVATRRAKG